MAAKKAAKKSAKKVSKPAPKAAKKSSAKGRADEDTSDREAASGPATTEVVDEFFGPDADKAATAKWAEENEQKRKGGGKFIPYMSLKDGKSTLVSFLTEKGKIMYLHRVTDAAGHHKSVLCKREKCELCATGDKAKPSAVYPLIDWRHSYENSKGEIVKFPQFKIMQCGQVSASMLAKSAEKKNGGKLNGVVWELSRNGSGPQTVYTIEMDRELKGRIPFDKEKTVKTSDGKELVVREIKAPQTWPLEEPGSVYQIRKMNPGKKITLDLNKSEHVEMWLQMHFLNSPGVLYGASISSSKGKDEADGNGAESGEHGSTEDDSEIPF